MARSDAVTISGPGLIAGLVAVLRLSLVLIEPCLKILLAQVPVITVYPVTRVSGAFTPGVVFTVFMLVLVTVPILVAVRYR